ncbi:hypothetical protein ElyMa_006473800 [Elysia marginata]|uniref:Uncharacterized protein n=1 Tax=Elysia marginata TaxID=1093978 RepID=A0AAV4I1S9_9GAST|nr:hypothetical protein ElyMa_006473800 [Elysia marginata]
MEVYDNVEDDTVRYQVVPQGPRFVRLYTVRYDAPQMASPQMAASPGLLAEENDTLRFMTFHDLAMNKLDRNLVASCFTTGRL